MWCTSLAPRSTYLYIFTSSLKDDDDQSCFSPKVHEDFKQLSMRRCNHYADMWVIYIHIYDTIIFLRRERSRPRIESPNAFIVISFGKQKSMTVTDRPGLWGYERVREKVGCRDAIRSQANRICIVLHFNMLAHLYHQPLPLLSLIPSRPLNNILTSLWSCHTFGMVLPCRGVQRISDRCRANFVCARRLRSATPSTFWCGSKG